MTEQRDEGRAVRARLSSGFLVIRNTFIVVGSQGAIAIMGLIAVPLLVSRLGAPKFGILALAWVVIGYASVLDLGLGRALTKVTADRLGAGKPEEIPKLFWTATALLTAIGVAVGALVIAISGPLTSSVLNVPGDLTAQAQTTFALLGCTVPFVLLSTAFAGSLEARQRFDITNGISVPLSFLSFYGPVAIAFFTTDLPLVVSAVCLSRVCATALYFTFCLRVDPSLRGKRKPERSLVGILLSFGGWVTVAAVVVGLMLAADRFVIGAVLDTTDVAFYATPFEASQKILLFASAFSNVLFPGFAANVGRDRGRTESLFSRGARGTIIGLFPFALITSVLSFEILNLWINHSFAVRGGPVMEILAAGVLVNGLAFVAFALIQSTRPDIIAKVAIVEFVLYIGLLWLLLETDGIEGAALAFALRAAADTAALYYFTHRLRLVRLEAILRVAWMAGIGVALIALGALLPSTVTRIAYLLIVLAAFVPFAWFRILEPLERERLAQRLRELRGAVRTRLKHSPSGAA